MFQAQVGSSFAYSSIKLTRLQAITPPLLFRLSASYLKALIIPPNCCLIRWTFPQTNQASALKLSVQSCSNCGHSNCSWKSALSMRTAFSQLTQYLKSSLALPISQDLFVDVCGMREVDARGRLTGDQLKTKFWAGGPAKTILSGFWLQKERSLLVIMDSWVTFRNCFEGRLQLTRSALTSCLKGSTFMTASTLTRSFTFAVSGRGVTADLLTELGSKGPNLFLMPQSRYMVETQSMTMLLSILWMASYCACEFFPIKIYCGLFRWMWACSTALRQASMSLRMPLF